MDSHKSIASAKSPRKPVKRRSHTTRVCKDSAINMAGARREIVTALNLHNTVNKPNFTVGSQFYCCSLINTLPTPEPIWSTTEPSVLAAPASPGEELEFVLAENESSSSSWSWWLGFLKTLDKSSDRGWVVEEPINAGDIFMEKSGEKSSVEQSDDQIQGSFPDPDEWLVIPANYDEDEKEAVP